MSHILKHHGYSSAFGINSIAIYNTLLTIVPMRVPIHKFTNSDILADMAMKPEHLGADH
jgi:hypothetical protein